MRRRGVLGTIALLLVIVLMLGIIGGAVYIGYKTNWYTDWSIFAKKSDGNDAEDPEGGKEDNSVQDGDGTALTSGEVYALPTALIYSASTAQSNDAGDGIRVTATVTPPTAANKNVIWNAKFANAESEWAANKVVSDYFTAVPEEGNPNTVLLTCKNPFGEQIILTAASAEDHEKTASCTVDFRQKITNVSFHIGNVPVNLGGDTNVSIDITSSNKNVGGEMKIDYTLSDVYTLEERIITDVDFTHGSSQNGSGNWFAQSNTAGGPNGASGIEYEDVNVSGTMYFDLRLFENYGFQQYDSSWTSGELVTTTTLFKDLPAEELAYIFESNAAKGTTKLWNIKVSLVSLETDTVFEYESNLIWSACTGVNVNLDQSGVIF